MKKIFYIPGLMSAILIPILFWYYGNQKFEEINVSVIDIGLPAKEREGIKNTFASFEPYRNWDYRKINVVPGTAEQNSNLYISELRNLQKRNKKESGIEFILGQNNTYGDFVSVLNDLAIAKQEQYAVDLEKTGHIFAVYVDPNIQQLDYNSFSCYVFTGKEYTPSFFEKAQQFLTKLPKESYYIIFGFLLFMHVSMLSIKERFQLHINSK